MYALANARGFLQHQTFGEKTCHPERSEGSLCPASEILRCAQDDSQDPSPVRSREASLQMSTAASKGGER